jgi:Ap4A phosphorylase N-terminal domain
VQHLSDTHTLLLNKYNLLEHHTLVVTRRFESQEDPLTAGDLEATCAVMQVGDCLLALKSDRWMPRCLLLGAGCIGVLCCAVEPLMRLCYSINLGIPYCRHTQMVLLHTSTTGRYQGQVSRTSTSKLCRCR